MSEDYEIKMDGEQHQYESGAVRYIKDKGDFNLIPVDVVMTLSDYIRTDALLYHPNICTKHQCMDRLLCDAFHKLYESAIVDIVILKYLDITFHEKPDGRINVTQEMLISAFASMLLDLAIHYQKGAQKYGVDNWKKGCENGTGIPAESFFDSGVRHTLQFLSGATDEPHHISAIWNFFGAIYMRDEMWKHE